MPALYTWETFAFKVIRSVALHSRDVSRALVASRLCEDEASGPLALRASRQAFLLLLRKKRRKDNDFPFVSTDGPAIELVSSEAV